MSKTCFVIMGFGTKKVPNTNIKVNLDDTYKYLIKPTLIKEGLFSIHTDSLHRHSFRCDEFFTTQAIDETFIKNLYLADIVVADITALNQNAIYELGMRHAMKPKSTIILCDTHTVNNNKFFDITFNPYILYDSEKQKDADEIKRVAKVLSNTIKICINSDSTYIDSPVFRTGVYQHQISQNYLKSNCSTSLRQEIEVGKKLLENENYIKAECVFKKILDEYHYITDEIICAYVLSFYKKEISVTNLEKALEKLGNYVDLNNTTYEDVLGIAAAIYLRMYNITQEKYYLFFAIKYYRIGSFYESGNIYCGKNYCSTLLKIYLVENDVEILKEYYYSAVHNAKVYLTQACTIKRKSDEYNDIWFLSNQSDLLLIANNGAANDLFKMLRMTVRQKNTIEAGRKDLIEDIQNIRLAIGVK